ncbi:hypothetical protein [Microbacterium sp. EST19A]|uniref:hypothetical protein n=1 Tax=Microbacterium sp. EST19A TaxID=2862681 RepID=UPI001CBC1184|nr:hypothetical protein [Microbacterium sp. EST19A]
MVLEIGGELVVYLVACAVGVSIGISSAMTPPRGLGVIVTVVSVIMTGGIVATGFFLGAEAPWVGPVFILAAISMRVVAGAIELARYPALSGESFLLRSMLVLFPRRARIPTDESTTRR